MSIAGENFFYVYQRGVATKQIHGTVTYRVTLDIKDNKYRYTVSDFVYHYYQKDRNFNYVPTGRTKPLEDTEAHGWQKTWEKHKTYTSEQVQVLVKKLKDEIKPPPPSSVTTTKASDF